MAVKANPDAASDASRSDLNAADHVSDNVFNGLRVLRGQRGADRLNRARAAHARAVVVSEDRRRHVRRACRARMRAGRTIAPAPSI